MKHTLILIVFLCMNLSLNAVKPNLLEDCHKLLSDLTLREKIGQLCMVAAVSNEEKNPQLLEQWERWQPLYNLKTAHIERLIKEHAIGGVIFFGPKTLPEEQLALTKHFQSLSKIPLFIALDAERGLASHVDQNSVMRFPYNMTLGAANDPALTYKVGFEVAQQLKSLGVHINFAPVVDINNNPKNPVIGMRSFGSDKILVTQHGIAYMQGLQDAGVIACAKHFPGHGDTSTDSHEALPYIPHSREHLEQIELYPFKQLIKAGVKSVMTAHLEVPGLENAPGLPSSLSRAIVTELLKNTFEFEGLVITDALGMHGAANFLEPGKLEVAALQAGSDILLCPVDPAKAIACIEQAVLDGTLKEDLLDKKVLKVLQAKAWAFMQATSCPKNLNKLNTAAAKELKKTIFSKAITIAKGSANPLPLTPLETAVVCTYGNDLSQFEESMACVRIVDVLDSAVRHSTHVIIALSEKYPFNEKPITDQIFLLKQRGKTVTVVLFCSPYRIAFVQEADTIIIAYESDPDAQHAAAEVLRGIGKPCGKIPVEFSM